MRYHIRVWHLQFVVDIPRHCRTSTSPQCYWPLPLFKVLVCKAIRVARRQDMCMLGQSWFHRRFEKPRATHRGLGARMPVQGPLRRHSRGACSLCATSLAHLLVRLLAHLLACVLSDLTTSRRRRARRIVLPTNLKQLHHKRGVKSLPGSKGAVFEEIVQGPCVSQKGKKQ